MRLVVRDLVTLGPFPDEESATDNELKRRGELLEAIAQPTTDEEACALVGLFGPDSCYEMAWTLLHLIESAPGWPLEDCLARYQGEWIDLFTKERAQQRLDTPHPRPP